MPPLRTALFDEPLNNLDMKHAVTMMKLLQRAAAELGKTIVIVLHDINFASCYSDYIVAMRNGKVAFQGAPDNIVRPDVLQAVYDTAFEVHELQGNRIVTYLV